MRNETFAQFLARGGKVIQCEKPPEVENRKHYTQKDKIDIAMGNRKTGASKMFNTFAKAFLNKGNTSWKYGK